MQATVTTEITTPLSFESTRRKSTPSGHETGCFLFHYIMSNMSRYVAANTCNQLYQIFLLLRPARRFFPGSNAVLIIPTTTTALVAHGCLSVVNSF